MLAKLIAIAATVLLVSGCALAGGRGPTSPEAADQPAASPTLSQSIPTHGSASPTRAASPIAQATDASATPAPIDDFDADMAAALTYLVATWGGSPSDYTLLVSTIATVPRSGEKLWAAKFMDAPADQIHEVYRNSRGEVGGLELWKETFDPPPPTPRQGRSGPPVPGKPYDGAEILNLLNFMPDPNGLPPELSNAAATDLIASVIWTFDGTKYDHLQLSGSCSQHTCAVDVSGQRSDSRGGDTHFLVIELPALTLRSAAHDLGAYPTALDPKLEEVARQLVEPRELRGMTYRGASWHLPPKFDLYTLTFAAETTETSPGKRVTIDLDNRTLISIEDFTF